MPRPSKNFVPFSCKMDTEVYRTLEVLCSETGMSKTVAVERAVTEYVERLNEQKQLLQKAKLL